MQNDIIQYQQRVKQIFSNAKACTTYTMALAHSLSLPNNTGYLLPICELHATDDVLITKLAKSNEI